MALDFSFPSPEQEARVVAHESGIDAGMAHGLVALGGRLRTLQDQGLAEVPSTRLLVHAGRLMAGGIEARQACHTAIVAPLSDDPTLVSAMRDLVDATFV